jgi:GWxTD domain-containing protein
MSRCGLFNRMWTGFWALLLVHHLGAEADAQGMFRGPELNRERSSQIRYESLVLPASHPDSLDYRFYVQIEHTQLQFVLDTEGVYRANYEITAALLTEKGTVISNQIRLGSATDIQDMEKDQRTANEIEYFHFKMPNIGFTLYLELFDRETRRSFYTEDKITPPSISSIFLSDIFFFRQIDGSIVEPSTLRPASPVTRNETDSTLKSIVFLASKEFDKSVSVHRSLITSDGRFMVDDTNDVYLGSSIQPLLIHLPVKLDFGSYQLRLELLDPSDSQIKQRTFFVKWGEMNSWMPDLQLAIESLVHVTDESEIKDVLTRTREEQEIWLKDFWKSRNPNQNRVENPLQIEYYRRVMTANKQFSSPDSNRPGWKTDRGYVYIVYGAPTDVDRPQSGFGESSRYEIWFYRNIQKRFIFMDKFGSGNYQLVSEE